MRIRPTCFAALVFLLAGITAADTPAVLRPLPNSPDASEENADLLRLVDSSLYSRTTAHFVIFHDPQTDFEEVKTLASLLEQGYRQFFAFFLHAGLPLTPPDQKLTWVCFSGEDAFYSYTQKADKMDLSWLDAYYSSRTNRVAILMPPGPPGARPALFTLDDSDPQSAAFARQPSGEVMRIVHELAHQMAFNTGPQKRRVMYPFWVSEGLAVWFENHICGSLNGDRCRDLAEMQNQRHMLPLEKLITLTCPPSDPQLRRQVYAQALAFFSFLLEQHGEDLSRYLGQLHKLEPGRRPPQILQKEFTRCFGSEKGIQTPWVQYLEKGLACSFHIPGAALLTSAVSATPADAAP